MNAISFDPVLQPRVTFYRLAVTMVALGCMVSPASSALVGYYTFDNFMTPLIDDSGNALTLSLSNGGGRPTHFSTGGFGGGGAYNFNGDRLIAPIDINPGTRPTLTMGAWVQTNALTGLHKVVGSDNGGGDRTMGLDSRGNGFSGGFGDRYSAFTGVGNPAGGLIESPVATFAPTGTGANDWSFVAVTYDQGASSATMYADIDASTTGDALVSFTKSPTNLGSGFSTIAIGGLRPDNAAESWNGKIDNVFVFDTALSAADLTAIRNGTSPLLPQPAAGPQITLMDPTTNDGSFESNTIATNGAPTTLPPVWTIAETSLGGVLSNPPHNNNFMSDGSDAVFSDDGTTTATSFNLLGGAYTAVSEGDLFEWAVDFNDGGGNSTAMLEVDFGNGPVLLGNGVTADGDIATMHTIAGTYVATAADAAGGLLSLIASLTPGPGNSYLDNVRFGVTPFQEPSAVVPEPASLAVAALGLLGIGLLGWRRRHVARG